MPAIGSSKGSERGLQAAIKARAKKPATPVRKLPPAPVHAAAGVRGGVAQTPAHGVTGSVNKPTHHAPFSLHTVESGLHAAGHALEKFYPTGKSHAEIQKIQRSRLKMGLPGATVSTPQFTAAAGGVSRKWQDIGFAFSKNPSGTFGHTVGSIVPAANALLTGTVRIATETAKGHPKALLAIPAGIAKEAKEEYGSENRAKDIAKIEHKGFLNPVLDTTLVLGGAATAAGRGISGVIRASGRGAEAFAKTQTYRDALVSALKSPTVHDITLPPKPTAREVRKAASFEATQPRPNLRTAPGREAPNLKPGAAVRPQGRSRNYFRARVQTAIDNARRRLQIKHLEKVAKARAEVQAHPHVAGATIGHPYSAQLAEDTARGEVMPLMQRHGGLTKFLGAARAQRIGASRIIGGERVLQGRVAHGYQRASEKALGHLSPQQRRLLVFAKEGHIPLDSPEKAARWLQELHDQAREGSAGLRQGIQRIAEGTDVARETGSLLAHIKKHGAESVFTPEFQRAVEQIPDERLVSGRNPVLAPQKDRAIARKYLPQMHMLAEWARRHPEHPDAPATSLAVTQIHQLNERGFDLRQAATGRGKLPHEPEGQRAIRAEAALERAKARLRDARSTSPPAGSSVAAAEKTLRGAKAEFVAAQKELRALKKNPSELHARADESLTTAKNLADETAKMHGLPTDRAYIPHVRTLADTHGAGVVGYSPADYKRWEGLLQAHGTRSTDPSLVMRALERSLRDEHSMRAVNGLEERFAVKLPSKDMTVRQTRQWLADTGRNPDDFAIVHFGKLRQNIQEGATAEHLGHLNLDATDHARLLEHAVDRAADNGPAERGTSVIPRAAYHEIQAQLRQSAVPFRGFGKLKGQVSKLMLGLSLPWATTMHLTYAIQSLMGGAGPVDFLSNVKYYKGLGVEDKARFDHAFGVDSPYHVSTHGIEPEKIGIPTSLQGLTEQMRVMRQSPMGRFLAKGNPVDALLRFERNPRRLSRINAAMKGVKHQAIREMGSHMASAQKDMNAFEQGARRLQHVGRMPADEYMKKAFANTKAMERVAEHVVHVMGEWHNMTAFERNVMNRSVMFYPWVRYSLKLMAHTLPTRHPLILAAALKLGEMEHHELVELLGTEPELGAVYLGPAQANVPAEKRKFQEFGIKQANPVINTVMESFSPETGGAISQIFSALPPYMASAIGYAVGKNLFSDKPLTGGKLGEAQEVKGRPGVGGYALHEVEQLFFPTRILGHQLTGTRPQASESAPAFGLPKYRQYSKKFERKIAKEKHGKPILPELLPFIPHPAERLAQTVEKEKKETKAERKLAKKQAKRDDTWGTESTPVGSDSW